MSTLKYRYKYVCVCSTDFKTNLVSALDFNSNFKATAFIFLQETGINENKHHNYHEVQIYFLGLHV